MTEALVFAVFFCSILIAFAIWDLERSISDFHQAIVPILKSISWDTQCIADDMPHLRIEVDNDEED